MIDTERALRQLVMESFQIVQHRVIEAMFRDWDISGNGCVHIFIRQTFPDYWLAEVGKN